MPAGQFAFKSGGRYRFLSTYPSQIDSLPEALGRAGYTRVVVAANPLYFLSGLAYDGTDAAVNTTVVPSAEINRSAFAALDAADAERPLFLLVHYMDVHHWKQWHFEADAERGTDEYRDAVVESYRAGARATDEALAAPARALAGGPRRRCDGDVLFRPRRAPDGPRTTRSASATATRWTTSCCGCR